MNWQDEGFLISKIKFRENANIINVFTNSFGKVSGIVYGGNSRKIRNHLQLTNKIFVFYSSKSENKLGYFKTELVEAISPKFFNNKEKTSALLSISNILNIILPDSQPNKEIFNSLNNLVKKFDKNYWIILYVLWELDLIKNLGFDPNLDRFSEAKEKKEYIKTVKIDNINYQVPFFLLDKIDNFSIEKKFIKTALNFNRNLMLNKFFAPNNLVIPKSRIILENYFI
jgi:DNA repair protein RecO (recombination protein O)